MATDTTLDDLCVNTIRTFSMDGGYGMKIAVAAGHAGYALKSIVIDDLQAAGHEVTDRGVVLQITCDNAADVPVPRRAYTFGVVKAAQACGDFQVLAERGRRALRVHLGPDVGADLATLQGVINKAWA